MIGVLPGIGPLAAIAMLLPLTFKLNPVAALIMLSGIYYGTKYGGSTTAIMLKLPGESASVVTCLDGYEMAKQGRAGPALGMAAVASFIAGSIGTVLIGMFGPPLAEVALLFGAPEYFSLMLFSLIGAAVLVHGSMLKALGMIVLGLLLGIVGTDVNSGMSRFTFGVTGLTDGISFVVIAMGLFGFAEIVSNLEQSSLSRDLLFQKVKNLWPTWTGLQAELEPDDARHRPRRVLRHLCPARDRRSPRSRLTRWRRRSRRTPAQFGKGAIEGVASPEAANNSASQCEFIPTLALGIPGSATMALILGALTIQGIAPGPQVMTQRPDLFWGLIASMWIGNLMLLVLNLPLIGLWVKLLTVPYRLLFPAIMVFMAIGVYSVNNNPLDIHLALLFGCAGLRLHQAQVRAGAVDPGGGAGAAHGGEPAARDADFARRPERIPHAADQRGFSDRDRLLLLAVMIVAGDQEQAERGLRRTCQGVAAHAKRRMLVQPLFVRPSMRTPASIAKHPIHPMLVTIPIGLWIFSLATDLVRVAGSTDPVWPILAFYTMTGGLIGAFARRRTRLDRFAVLCPKGPARPPLFT